MLVSYDVEGARLEGAMRRAGWASHTSLSRELAKWDRVASVVNSYEGTPDEYANDLYARDYIAVFGAKASAALRIAIDGRVAAADDRFRASTVPDIDGRLSRFHRTEQQDGWWWHRRPASGPLARQLMEP